MLSLLQARAAKMVEELCRGFGCAASFRQVGLELESPIDYAEILRKLGGLLEELRLELRGARLSVLLDSGTPQMQTILEHFRRPGSTPKLTLSLPEGGLDLKALLYQVERHFYQQAPPCRGLAAS